MISIFFYQCERGWLKEIMNPTVVGCMDEIACNFDPDVNEPDESCIYPNPGACDCAGNVFDECNICGGGGLPHGAECCNGEIKDCTGQCGGNAHIDCFNICGGVAEIDDCGVCGGDGICYNSLKITSVKINDYYDGDGNYWDWFSATDPYVSLEIGNNTLQHTDYEFDFNYSNLPLTLDFEMPQFIYDFNTSLKVYLKDDDDPLPYETIGYTLTFTPNDILESSNINQYNIQGSNETSFTLYIQWFD